VAQPGLNGRKKDHQGAGGGEKKVQLGHVRAADEDVRVGFVVLFVQHSTISSALRGLVCC